MKQKHASTMLCWASLLMAFALGTLSLTGATGNPPELMTYQGYLTDGNGQPLGADNPKNYDVVFRIWSDQNAGGGKNLWTEQQTVTVDKGYFSVLLGEGAMYGSELRPPLSTVFTNTTDASDRFIEFTVRNLGGAGNDVLIQPRLRFLSSPYAFLAHNAVSAGNLVNSGNSQVVSVTGTNVGINKLNADTALDVAGTVTATGLTINGTATLTNVNGPTTFNSDIGLTSTHCLELGKNVSGKEGSAGKIAYQRFTTDSLDIVGAGTTIASRKVKIFAEGGLTVGGSVSVGGSASISGSVSATGPCTAPSFVGNGTIPLGGIIIWSGQPTQVPTGWTLCDGRTVTTSAGTYTTPNLKDRFVLGGGGNYAYKASGGATNHTLLPAEMPSHTHSVGWKSIFSGRDSNTGNAINVQEVWGVAYTTNTTPTGATGGTASGSTTAFSTMPPYYTLAYIMRTE